MQEAKANIALVTKNPYYIPSEYCKKLNLSVYKAIHVQAVQYEDVRFRQTDEVQNNVSTQSYFQCNLVPRTFYNLTGLSARYIVNVLQKYHDRSVSEIKGAPCTRGA